MPEDNGDPLNPASQAYLYLPETPADEAETLKEPEVHDDFEKFTPAVSPQEPAPKTADSCWYCKGDGCDHFSGEFDTPLHEKCLRAAAADPEDREAAIMSRELLAAREPDGGAT